MTFTLEGMFSVVRHTVCGDLFGQLQKTKATGPRTAMQAKQVVT